MSVIQNGSNTPLSSNPGTLPDMSSALLNWFQTMTFIRIVTTVVGFQAKRVKTPVVFQGVIQAYTDRQLALLPEGERSWTWLWLHAEPALTLNTGEEVEYDGIPTRIMGRKDYTKYGYVEYKLCQNWTG